MTHTTLPLSKELYQKGLKIETEKWWNAHDRYNPDNNTTYADGFKIENYKKWGKDSGGYYSYPAYSTDELLAVMPPVRMNKVVPNFYNVKYNNGVEENLEEDKVLCEALGRMCLWLFQNGYHFNGKELGR